MTKKNADTIAAENAQSLRETRPRVNRPDAIDPEPADQPLTLTSIVRVSGSEPHRRLLVTIPNQRGAILAFVNNRPTLTGEESNPYASQIIGRNVEAQEVQNEAFRLTLKPMTAGGSLSHSLLYSLTEGGVYCLRYAETQTHPDDADLDARDRRTLQVMRSHYVVATFLGPDPFLETLTYEDALKAVPALNNDKTAAANPSAPTLYSVQREASREDPRNQRSRKRYGSRASAEIPDADDADPITE